MSRSDKVVVTPSTALQNVADFFIANAHNSNRLVSNKKLQKLVYYAQAWSLVFNKEKLFEEPIEAWIHGPAIRCLYSQYKKYGFSSITDKVAVPEFDKKRLAVLNEVWAVYGKYDADYLEVLTHNEEPWIVARQNVEEDQRSDHAIDLDLMQSYYSGLIKSK